MLPNKRGGFVVGFLVLGVVLLSINRAPSVGEIGAYYFSSLNKSEIWINLQPQGLEAGPDPILLNVTISFPGRRLSTPPETVELRAKSRDIAFPFRVRQPILRLTLGDGKTIDVTGLGHAYQFFPSCRGCAYDTIVAPLSLATFRNMARSDDAVVEALGFTVRLRSSDAASLRHFIESIESGVVIR
jgi:hypothetical protein